MGFLKFEKKKAGLKLNLTLTMKSDARQKALF